MDTKTGRRARWPAYLLCVQWGVGALALCCTAWWGELGAGGWAIWALMAVAAVALVGWFTGRRWGPRLAMLQWAVQIPVLATGSFQYFLWFGLQLHLKIEVGSALLGVNIYALALLLWTAYLQQQVAGQAAAKRPGMPAVAKAEG
ncbi:hypothetical protein [Stenotrophomonas panacihumi]|nr:hypothetical protein [Stenotrophomonas panacihumi]